MGSINMDVLFGAIITVVAGGVGVLILFGFIMSQLEVVLSAGWPSTQGKITDSYIQRETSHSRNGTSTSYEPKVKYTYTVGGQTFEGHKIGFGVQVSGGEDEAAKALKPYPVGAACTVYYGPRNPAVSVLERKVINPGWTLFFAFLCLATGAGGLIYLLNTLGVFKRLGIF